MFKITLCVLAASALLIVVIVAYTAVQIFKQPKTRIHKGGR